MLLAYDQGYSRPKWRFDPIWPKGSYFQGQREIVRLLPWTLYISDFLNQARKNSDLENNPTYDLKQFYTLHISNFKTEILWPEISYSFQQLSL